MRTIILIGMLGLFLVGCTGEGNFTKEEMLVTEKQTVLEVEVFTCPVVLGRSNFACDFMMDGQKVLAYNPICMGIPLSYATAKINSELDDGDNEKIKLIGHYEGERFKVDAIVVEGYTIEFAQKQ